MIKVYTPPANIDIYSEWLGDSNQFERSSDISQVLLQEIKIACVPVYFNEINDSRYNFDYTKFDLLLISDIEFSRIRPIREWLLRSDIKNYIVALGGFESGSDITGDFVYRPWWSFNLIKKNTDQYNDISTKPFVFDMLLGMKKPHRDWLLARSIESGLESKSICLYRDVFNVVKGFDDDRLDVAVPHPFISANMRPEYEVAENITFQVSDRVPWKIYEQTRYSVVPETVYNDVFFFSEKPTKVLMARRLFVVFSCQHYLKYMREKLGFKTFDGIIDESYDLEPDVVKRFDLAFKEMLKLADRDFAEVQALSKEIREYNYQRLYTLMQEKSDQMLNLVYNKIKEIKDVNNLQ